MTDWKPTIIGLIIAAVIVAALFTRPTWGAAELATLGGAVGTAMLGVFARFGSATAPTSTPAGAMAKAVKAPPLSMFLLAFVLMIVIHGTSIGCSLNPAQVAIAGALTADQIACVFEALEEGASSSLDVLKACPGIPGALEHDVEVFLAARAKGHAAAMAKAPK